METKCPNCDYDIEPLVGFTNAFGCALVVCINCHRVFYADGLGDTGLVKPE